MVKINIDVKYSNINGKYNKVLNVKCISINFNKVKCINFLNVIM